MRWWFCAATLSSLWFGCSAPDGGLEIVGSDAGAGPRSDGGVPDARHDARADAPHDADAGADAGVAAFTRYPHDEVYSPITASVVARIQAIAASASRQDNVFMKVGASGTVSAHFLRCLATPGSQIELSDWAMLQPTIDLFRSGDAAGATPFDRITIAAEVGRSAKWAITGSPSPLERELADLDARFAIVNYATNDMQLGATYASAVFSFAEHLQKLLDALAEAGVVPLVFGLNPRADRADAAAWVPAYDATTRGLAEARQVPYVSLYLQNRDLPNQGLSADGIHGNVYTENGQARPCDFSSKALDYNYNARNLGTLRVLRSAEAALAAGSPLAPNTSTVEGRGTSDDPFVVDALPFSHTYSTVGGARTVDSYPACGDQDESGPEIFYRLSLAVATDLKVMLFERDGVDVDVHYLAELQPTRCVQRDDRMLETKFAAGTSYLAVDTFAPSSGEQPGEYTLVISD